MASIVKTRQTALQTPFSEILQRTRHMYDYSSLAYVLFIAKNGQEMPSLNKPMVFVKKRRPAVNIINILG